MKQKEKKKPEVFQLNGLVCVIERQDLVAQRDT